MNEYKITLILSAECEADARELLNDYTGQETSLSILTVDRWD